MSKIKLLQTEALSDNWYMLNKATYEIVLPDGSRKVQSREAQTIMLLQHLQRRWAGLAGA